MRSFFVKLRRFESRQSGTTKRAIFVRVRGKFGSENIPNRIEAGYLYQSLRYYHFVF